MHQLKVRDLPLTYMLAIIGSIAVVGFATGLTVPMVSLRLHHQGFNEFVIGVLAAAPALGMILSAPLVQRLVAKVGRKQAILTSIVTSGISIILLEVDSSLSLWVPLRII